MIIYVILQYILMAVTTILIGYLFLLGMFALLPKENRVASSAFDHSFLIVIHSQNKEQKISKTLYSLGGLVYPWNLYDLLVVSGNRTSKITAMSNKLGAKIIDCDPSDRDDVADIYKKALTKIEYVEEKYDAIVIVRPGDLISDNLLEVMNQYLQEGSLIIQSANQQISDLSTWELKYQNLSWVLRTFINALGRKKVGLGTSVLESGICIRTEVLMNNPVKFDRLYSELGYSRPLQAAGLKIDFSPETMIWSPFNNPYKETIPEMSHWLIKQLQLIKKHLQHFIGQFNKKNLSKSFQLLVSIISEPLLLIIAVMGNGIINLSLWWLGYIPIGILEGWLALIVLTISYLLIGLVAAKNNFLKLNNKDAG